MHYYRRAAEEGHLESQYNVAALILEDGDSTQAQRDEALVWLARAAEQGFPKAVGSMGILLWRSRGATDQVLDLFRKAAAGGDLNGLYGLGHCLLHGDGVAADRAEGLRLLAQAAQHGHPTAKQLIDAESQE